MTTVLLIIYLVGVVAMTFFTRVTVLTLDGNDFLSTMMVGGTKDPGDLPSHSSLLSERLLLALIWPKLLWDKATRLQSLVTSIRYRGPGDEGDDEA